jgi:hypothetical protein
MKIYNIVIFVSLISLSSQVAEDDTLAQKVFLKSEHQAIEFRKKLKDVRLVDPIEMNEVFYEIVTKQTPNLYLETNKYKNGLINILYAKDIERDLCTNQDVFRVLYNLCIDDYIDVVDTIYSLYKRNLVKFEDLNASIDVDFNMSNQLGKKYQNKKVRIVLSRILEDIRTLKVLDEDRKQELKEEIEKILSGELWEKELKLDEIVRPPFLKQIDCD